MIESYAVFIGRNKFSERGQFVAAVKDVEDNDNSIEEYVMDLKFLKEHGYFIS